MEKKACYGILDKVFPFGNEGLRQVPPDCLRCPDRLSCLKAAISTKEGCEMRSDNLRKIPAKGLIDRIKRWSQKKELSRLADENRKK
ncbi:MAG: hypothetical protein JXL81_09325 [Deltaproteobacteria bacterium]|nr:hypothetical protein [Deltaproteobacteria bacterium]